MQAAAKANAGSRKGQRNTLQKPMQHAAFLCMQNRALY